MRMLSLLTLLWASGTTASAWAADLTKIERTIAKQPAYKTKPKYGLMVLGPQAKACVWLVLDGDVLYVDRNGNGDLTENGERIKQAGGFPIGELALPDDSFPQNSSGLWAYRGTYPGAAADSITCHSGRARLLPSHTARTHAFFGAGSAGASPSRN